VDASRAIPSTLTSEREPAAMLGDDCFADRVSRRTLVFVWITLFCLNLIFPLRAGMSLAREHGKLGILVAVLSAR
jgi:hypothetical protein